MTIKRYKHQKDRRRARVRGKISSTQNRPRLTVFRSNKHIYAQIISTPAHKTLVSASDLKTTKKSTKTDSAKEVGANLAKLAVKNKINTVVFDRGHYRYHGRVKALADAARNQGLEF